MYGTRFNGHPKNKDDHDQMDTVPDGPSPPPSSPLSKLDIQIIFGVKRRISLSLYKARFKEKTSM